MLNKNTQGAKKARPIRSSSYQVDILAIKSFDIKRGPRISQLAI